MRPITIKYSLFDETFFMLTPFYCNFSHISCRFGVENPLNMYINVLFLCVGRGGSRKRELEEESGASLHIKDVDGEGVVEIRGGDEACSKAKELIEAIVR